MVCDDNPFDFTRTSLEPPAPVSNEQKAILVEEDEYREYLAQLKPADRVDDLYKNLVDIYDDDRTNWAYSALKSDEEAVPCLFRIKRDKYVPGDMSIFSEDEFHSNFRRLTNGALDGMNWNNVFMAGGGVLACVDKTAKMGSSDIDLFLYGLVNEAEANAKLKEIYELVSRNVNLSRGVKEKCKIIRSSRAVTILGDFPFRHIQIILRVLHSPSEVLHGFDIDSCAIGYNGSRVYAMKRTRRAITKRYNLVNASRRSMTFEPRLRKYAFRGFEIRVPDLDKAKVNIDRFPPVAMLPRQIRKKMKETTNLERLLLMEYYNLHLAPGQYGSRGADLGYNQQEDSRFLADQSDYTSVALDWGPRIYSKTIISNLTRSDRANIYGVPSKQRRHTHVFVTGIDGVLSGVDKSRSYCIFCKKGVKIESGPNSVCGPISWDFEMPVLQDWDKGRIRKLVTGSYQSVPAAYDSNVYTSGRVNVDAKHPLLPSENNRAGRYTKIERYIKFQSDGEPSQQGSEQEEDFVSDHESDQCNDEEEEVIHMQRPAKKQVIWHPREDEEEEEEWEDEEEEEIDEDQEVEVDEGEEQVDEGEEEGGFEHYQDHQPETFRCYQCGSEFTSENLLNKHIRSAHIKRAVQPVPAAAEIKKSYPVATAVKSTAVPVKAASAPLHVQAPATPFFGLWQCACCGKSNDATEQVCGDCLVPRARSQEADIDNVVAGMHITAPVTLDVPLTPMTPVAVNDECNKLDDSDLNFLISVYISGEFVKEVANADMVKRQLVSALHGQEVVIHGFHRGRMRQNLMAIISKAGARVQYFPGKSTNVVLIPRSDDADPSTTIKSMRSKGVTVKTLGWLVEQLSNKVPALRLIRPVPVSQSKPVDSRIVTQQMPPKFGQAVQSGFGQAVQSGFGQAVQSGFGQAVQSGFGQAVQSGFGQAASQPALVTMDEEIPEEEVADEPAVHDYENIKMAGTGSLKAWTEGSKGEPHFPKDYEIVRNDLLQVTRLGTNNNKYYCLELHAAEEKGVKYWRVFAHYGRTDDLTKNPNAGTRVNRYCRSLEHAHAEYNRLLHEKQGDNKGYRKVEVAHGTIGSKKARELAKKKEQELLASPSVPVPHMQLSSEVIELVEYIYKDALDYLKKMTPLEITVRGLETPLGVLSASQVKQGRDILMKIREEIMKADVPNRNNLRTLSSQYYTAIPHRIGRSPAEVEAAVIITTKQLEDEEYLIQLMTDMMSVSSSQGVLLSRDPVQKYAALKNEITVLDRSSYEYSQLENEIITSQVSPRIRIKRIYKISRAGESNSFDSESSSIPNHQLMYHGSYVSNFVGLLSRGILMPNDAVKKMKVKKTEALGWLGFGIYFGSAADTALKYAHPGSKGSRLMLVCEVAIGEPKEFTTQSYYLTDAVPGYHSSHGLRGSVFTEDEWVVYSTARQQQRYLVEFEDTDTRAAGRLTVNPPVTRFGSVPSTPAGALSSIQPIPEPLHGLYSDVAMLASRHNGDTRGLELVVHNLLYILQRAESSGDTYAIQSDLKHLINK